MKPEEREEALGTFRPKARGIFEAALKETLDDGQRARLRQLELQREGLFGSGEIWDDLRVTNEQRKAFMAEIQRTQKAIAPLMKEAMNGGNPDAIRPKVLKLRDDLQAKLESLLTDAQKTEWKAMLGKPVDPSYLFDDVSPR